MENVSNKPIVFGNSKENRRKRAILKMKSDPGWFLIFGEGLCDSMRPFYCLSAQNGREESVENEEGLATLDPHSLFGNTLFASR